MIGADPTGIETVECLAGVVVSVTTAVQHLCPYRDEVDLGAVSIRWTTDGRTVELHSLRAWLTSFAEVRTSHEEITEAIRAGVREAGVFDVEVDTQWDTAGMAVKVTDAVRRQRVVA